MKTGHGRPYNLPHARGSKSKSGKDRQHASGLEKKAIPKRVHVAIPSLSQKQINRLFKNVTKKSTGCWEWTKYRDADGYGSMHVKSRMYGSHRLSWIVTYGPIEKGLCVLHKCDNPPCINPDHLFLGTPNDNVQDCVKKKRHRAPKGEQHGQAVLTNRRVRLLREIDSEFSVRLSELARITGVSPSAVWQVLNGKSWRHV